MRQIELPIVLSYKKNEKKLKVTIKETKEEKFFELDNEFNERLHILILKEKIHVYKKEIKKNNLLKIINHETLDVLPNKIYGLEGLQFITKPIINKEIIKIKDFETRYCCKTSTNMKLYICYSEVLPYMDKIFNHPKNTKQYRIVLTNDEKILVISYKHAEIHDLTEFFNRLFNSRIYNEDSFYFTIMQELIQVDFNINTFKLLAKIKKKEENINKMENL